MGTTTVTQTVTIDTSVSEAGGSGTTTVTIDGVTQDTGATPDTENDLCNQRCEPDGEWIGDLGVWMKRCRSRLMVAHGSM